LILTVHILAQSPERTFIALLFNARQFRECPNSSGRRFRLPTRKPYLHSKMTA
jgi:hypothetical protein